MEHIDPLSVVALVVAVASVVVSARRKRGLSLSEIAIRAAAYAEQMGGGPHGKLRQAIEAAQRLDAGDNGKRDFTDAQLRVAIEAEIHRSTK